MWAWWHTQARAGSSTYRCPCCNGEVNKFTKTRIGVDGKPEQRVRAFIHSSNPWCMREDCKVPMADQDNSTIYCMNVERCGQFWHTQCCTPPLTRTVSKWVCFDCLQAHGGFGHFLEMEPVHQIPNTSVIVVKADSSCEGTWQESMHMTDSDQGDEGKEQGGKDNHPPRAPSTTEVKTENPSAPGSAPVTTTTGAPGEHVRDHECSDTGSSVAGESTSSFVSGKYHGDGKDTTAVQPPAPGCTIPVGPHGTLTILERYNSQSQSQIGIKKRLFAATKNHYCDSVFRKQRQYNNKGAKLENQISVVNAKKKK